MKESFHQKTSGLLVSALIGLIIISFMFTGYESMRGTPDTVAKVGDRVIKIREYQQEYERQIQFYSNYMFGGNQLNEEQIKNFQIRENTIKSLINRKLFVKFAENMGLHPAEEQIKSQVKEMEYFKTNGQFDIQRYKAILANARITPSEFEQDMSDQAKAQSIQELMANFPVSDAYLSDLVKFKSEMVKANLIQINKRGLTKFIEVSKAEMDKFTSEHANLERVKNLFAARKRTLNVAEGVKARHILLSTQGNKKKVEDVEKEANEIRKSLTPANFAKVADQKTEDPSGKGKGGALGDWFERGQMVPEFEKIAFELKPGTISAPVKTSYGYHIIYVEDHRIAKEAKFEDNKDNLTKELIQGEKSKDLDVLVAKIANEVKSALAQNKTAEVATLVKKYELTQASDNIINKLDNSNAQIKLKAEEVTKLFNENPVDGVFQFDDALSLTLAKKGALDKKDLEAHAVKTDAERENISSQISRKIGQEAIKILEQNVKVKVYNEIFRS